MNIKEIEKLRNDMEKYRPLDVDQIRALNKDIRVEHIWSSNAIEGSKIDKYETEAIIDKGITIHGESIGDVLSTIDLNEAYDYMLDLASHKQPLTQTAIRDLNRLALAKKDLKVKKQDKKKKEKKEPKKPSEGYFKQVRKEMKLVKWPSGKDVLKYTVSTIIFCVFLCLIFMGLNLITSLIRGWVG